MVEDFVLFTGYLAARVSASFSSFVFRGGSVGRAAGSYSGARIAKRSGFDVDDVLFDSVDKDVSAVAAELIESSLVRLLNAVEVRLLCGEESSSEGLRIAGDDLMGRRGAV